MPDRRIPGFPFPLGLHAVNALASIVGLALIFLVPDTIMGVGLANHLASAAFIYIGLVVVFAVFRQHIGVFYSAALAAACIAISADVGPQLSTAWTNGGNDVPRSILAVATILAMHLASAAAFYAVMRLNRTRSGKSLWSGLVNSIPGVGLVVSMVAIFKSFSAPEFARG